MQETQADPRTTLKRLLLFGNSAIGRSAIRHSRRGFLLPAVQKIGKARPKGMQVFVSVFICVNLRQLHEMNWPQMNTDELGAGFAHSPKREWFLPQRTQRFTEERKCRDDLDFSVLLTF